MRRYRRVCLDLLRPSVRYHDLTSTARMIPPCYGHEDASYPAYVATTPRPLPEVISYSPNQGPRGTKVTVYFRSIYDLDDPQVTPTIMFGSKKCQSVLTKTTQSGSTTHQYALSADAPPLTPTTTPSPEIPLCLTFEDQSVNWESPSMGFGGFTYLEQASPFFSFDSPPVGPKKRKLSPEASPPSSASEEVVGAARSHRDEQLPSRHSVVALSTTQRPRVGSHVWSHSPSGAPSVYGCADAIPRYSKPRV